MHCFPPLGHCFEDVDLLCASLGLGVHDIMVGTCSTDVVNGWRRNLCGDDDDDMRSWVAACPSDVDDPIRHWVRL